eukprot:CAMPEP_0172573498 /NCGR_PEP_ID=MMETSP1067-20121228/136215_1 /TAXON_ID=265564 ORGANISM="Thalassiosira punctigera, Strain Tpunct2005C2" /NCGR_SAMPLE_ID=MMETSP1067 /ASSEMBLY_ACC=CAM_ASM_000444 /LENGTH=101 /DNA_ID=CAMNT_0013366103 /DNA_START=614 /DNA_END=920 /DNA_ORIENTATION=+
MAARRMATVWQFFILNGVLEGIGDLIVATGEKVAIGRMNDGSHQSVRTGAKAVAQATMAARRMATVWQFFILNGVCCLFAIPERRKEAKRLLVPKSKRADP